MFQTVMEFYFIVEMMLEEVIATLRDVSWSDSDLKRWEARIRKWG